MMLPSNKKIWAKTRSVDSRLPLCTASITSLEWNDVKEIFLANMLAIYEIDAWTGFPMFMLAAIGLDSDLESVYCLLRAHPGAMLR